MKTRDAVIVGGGIIGLALSIALRKRGMSVLVVERGEPVSEASYAAAGMLADCTLETPGVLQKLATASARMYPEFVHELQDESGINPDLRDHGTILFPGDSKHHPAAPLDSSLPVPLNEFEPALAPRSDPAIFLKERSVDPRLLGAAALKAARHRGVDIRSGTAVTGVDMERGRVVGVMTGHSHYRGGVVVNCAGAWAGQVPPLAFPTRPVKGQMLSLIGVPRDLLRHVIRSPEVYLVPRSDGRILVGATVEEAGFDKRTVPETLQRLRHTAVEALPALAHARILEAWAGLRPGTPDDLPILGATSLPGYFVAAGHFRDGILLAPITAQLMAQVINGEAVEHDLAPYSAARFA